MNDVINIKKVNHCVLCNTIVEEYGCTKLDSVKEYGNYSNGCLHFKSDICSDCRKKTKYPFEEFYWTDCGIFVEKYSNLIVFANYENEVDMLFSSYIIKLISEEYQCEY